MGDPIHTIEMTVEELTKLKKLQRQNGIQLSLMNMIVFQRTNAGKTLTDYVLQNESDNRLKDYDGDIDKWLDAPDPLRVGATTDTEFLYRWLWNVAKSMTDPNFKNQAQLSLDEAKVAVKYLEDFMTSLTKPKKHGTDVEEVLVWIFQYALEKVRKAVVEEQAKLVRNATTTYNFSSPTSAMIPKFPAVALQAKLGNLRRQINLRRESQPWTKRVLRRHSLLNRREEK